MGEIVVEADDVEEEDDQLILTKSGAVVAIFAKRSVQGWMTDSLRWLRRYRSTSRAAVDHVRSH
jgi:hypothetical protein